MVRDACRDADCGLDFCPTTLLIWAYIASLNKSSITPFARKTATFLPGFVVLDKHQIPPNLQRLLNCNSCLLSCRDHSKLSILPLPLTFLHKNMWKFNSLPYLFSTPTTCPCGALVLRWKSFLPPPMASSGTKTSPILPLSSCCL